MHSARTRWLKRGVSVSITGDVTIPVSFHMSAPAFVTRAPIYCSRSVLAQLAMHLLRQQMDGAVLAGHTKTPMHNSPLADRPPQSYDQLRLCNP